MPTHPKIHDRQEVSKLIEAWKSDGKKVGLTSGAFDLVHPGHVTSLIDMKQHCDILVVALNSNASIKAYKSEQRPFVDAEARAVVVAAMEAVDAVFIFDEENNNQNIKTLEPNVYLKSGDYTKESLSSTPLVEAYGGEVKIIPFLKGFSSTSIIEKIQAQALTALPESAPPGEKAPAVFLDRDGTLIKLVDHLHEPEKLEILPGVIEGLIKLREAGYKLVVCTNQAGIGLGYFTVEDFFAVNRKMLGEISKGGALLDKIYFSPHSELDKTDYRKPGPGMINRAVKELNIDLEKSFMIGDSKVDIEAAKAAGCKSIVVLTGGLDKEKASQLAAASVVEGFSEAVEVILN